ncbi:hypothetical protein [Arenimonas terrae]|uniref:DUF4156 domain-containing protein n=1 Tax=Arenimonas terrae TaxID=2546226 RepID=A0A5C4RP03_9GAMM|nr:hypothetical protein [Arenimonas terrae]TNJ32983.1 hypothetical protein E1B00_11745 [Arenimonas terrae]
MNRLLSVPLVLLLAGCAGTSTVMMGPARAPVDPAQVRIYRTPPPDSVEIAQLESTSGIGFGTQGQTDAAIARLKREAGALGANGIILLGTGASRSPVGMSVGAASYGRHSAGGIGIGIPTTQKHAAGVAIYVPAPGDYPADASSEEIPAADSPPDDIPAADAPPED